MKTTEVSNRIGKLIAGALALLSGIALSITTQRQAAGLSRPQPTVPESTTGYVGSQECALCHQDIFQKYSHTDMGRSMLPAQTSTLGVPTSRSIVDTRLNRHFEVSDHNGVFEQTEYEVGSDGQEIFRETHQGNWIIGAGANGIGIIIKRDDYLFEAPLTFYSKTKTWELSPGYEYADYGFSRPILPGCVSCHSGRPQPIKDGNGRFRNPPFRELAIGCENCHGPGEAHIAAASSDTIVNPAKLPNWLADNICFSCHQSGDARVLQPGKDYGDFIPGTKLDRTLSIFMVPFTEGSIPKDDLLEHYLSMRLSKCYRQSEGRLSCISCHDPHQQPSKEEAPAYFRERCLTCHKEQSCSLSLADRQKLDPPDNCVGCHMPKRDVTVISHSVLTNHRIVATATESFPEMAFHMTTSQLPDLVYLSAPPDDRAPPVPIVQLQAYRQVMLTHPEYRQHFWKLGKELETTLPNNVTVLEALADSALQQKTEAGEIAAISYLERARKQGITQPADFEQLGRLLIATHRWEEAVDVLKQAVQNIPFDEELYRLLTQTYFSTKSIGEACKVSATASHLFPQDDSLRGFLTSQCASVKP